MARNRPARARSSTLISSTSSPSRVIVLPVTSYLGWPAIAEAWVDLPEPFGPMIAWVSPLLRVRSTPRRICLGSPSGVSTLTCRSRISRVDMCVCSFLSQWSGSWVRRVDVHQDVVSLDGDWIGGDRPGGGQAGGGAGVKVEHGAVQPALQRGALHLSLGQGDLSVGTDVVDGVVLPVLSADQCYFHQRSIGRVQFQAQSLALLQITDGRDDLGTHDVLAPGLWWAPSSITSINAWSTAPPVRSSITASSSSSMAASRRSSIEATPILAIISAKKPRTTRRRAAASGTPRERR